MTFRTLSQTVGIPALLVFGVVLAKASGGSAADPAAVERALDRFLSAPSRAAAQPLIKSVVESGATFDQAYARLKRGRSYVQTVPLGLQRLKRQTSDGLEHTYALVVPDDYTPKRTYQVRVQLHGGIARRTAEPGREGIDRIPATGRSRRDCRAHQRLQGPKVGRIFLWRRGFFGLINAGIYGRPGSSDGYRGFLAPNYPSSGHSWRVRLNGRIERETAERQ